MRWSAVCPTCCSMLRRQSMQTPSWREGAPCHVSHKETAAKLQQQQIPTHHLDNNSAGQLTLANTFSHFPLSLSRTHALTHSLSPSLSLSFPALFFSLTHTLPLLLLSLSRSVSLFRPLYLSCRLHPVSISYPFSLAIFPVSCFVECVCPCHCAHAAPSSPHGAGISSLHNGIRSPPPPPSPLSPPSRERYKVKAEAAVVVMDVSFGPGGGDVGVVSAASTPSAAKALPSLGEMILPSSASFAVLTHTM